MSKWNFDTYIFLKYTQESQRQSLHHFILTVEQWMIKVFLVRVKKIKIIWKIFVN